VALVGLRCSGKSTVGRLLAERLGRRFLDADEELARRFGGGRTAGELLAELGEPAFRQLEWRTLGALFSDSAGDSVIATGGGAVTSAHCRELLARRALCVYLRAEPAVLCDRASRDPALRPDLVAGRAVLDLERQLELREPLYLDLAAVIVDAGARTPLELAESLEAELRSRTRA